ncbi:sensor histidine kinase [Maribacter sp. MJ134]|uniref:histidine kinase n=1 Tax=Maribacter sp. MJ134 TaxID=2496865 RepID=UPI000F822CDA|nr:histidine kinase [Maribacter sp. MJ134]AZQ59064.1 sensor histidine kinase [Maribacter sp. MJ134]
MKNLFIHILFVLLGVHTCLSQQGGSVKKFVVKGIVQEKASSQPISGVSISTSSGEYTVTNGLGEFKIRAAKGEELTVEDSDFETVKYVIKSDEDIKVLVEDYVPRNRSSSTVGISKREASKHQSLLDSAETYKKKDIAKSIDFVARSIAVLGSRGNKNELAKSLTALGEIYLFHKQYDLAIDNFEDALEANKSIKTSLLLGETLIVNKQYQEANKVLDPLMELQNMVPYQRVTLFELLGDIKKGLNDVKAAVSFYNEGLKVATKNQITPKMTDLNSKIADAYSQGNQLMEAEAYYGNSLELANKLAPKRALQEKEKVADFYNKKSQFNEEIALRKNSLVELDKLNSPKSKARRQEMGDTITAQRINYKIANAYIAQDKYSEAIPYLERSIVEADSENDLVVQKDATRKLSEVYEFKGDFDKALETYQSYVTLVDTLYIRKEQEISRAARFNREIAATQSRITGLEQERELSQSKYDLALTEQELSEESYKRQRWVIYSLIVGLLLTGLAAFFFYRSNQQQKLANNLLALKSLRSQMNPHFIFNALNSVNNYIAKSDERSANRYLSEFSTLMRSVLENSEEDFIPLAKELQLLELYIKLEHSRFPDKFDYEIKIDDNIDISSFQIPPMLLQPYIENAIWHGLRYKKEKGVLKVNVTSKSERALEISISDDGIGRKKSAELKTANQKKQKSKGMGNIKQRVAILNDMYKDKVAVVITDLMESGQGTRVIFTIKKDK